VIVLLKVKKLIALYEKRAFLIRELKECQKEIKKLRKRKIKLYLLKLWIRIYKKYGFKWVDYKKLTKLLRKKQSREISAILQEMVNAKLIKRKRCRKDRRKSLYKLLRI